MEEFMKLGMIALVSVMLALIGCSQSGSDAQQQLESSEALMSKANSKVQVLVADTSASQKQSVVVNVDRVEILVAGQSRVGRLNLVGSSGELDLVTLQNGVTWPLGEKGISGESKISQIRIILKPEGHYMVDENGQRCELAIPSQQKTGLKLLIKDSLELIAGAKYTIKIGFNAEKSVVQLGNGGCLLKPVIKIASIVRSQVADPDVDGVVSGAGSDPGGSSGGGSTDGGSGGDVVIVPECMAGDPCETPSADELYTGDWILENDPSLPPLVDNF